MPPASAVHSRCPGDLLTAIRAATARHADWQQTAVLVAGQLRGFAPPGDIHRVRNCGDDVAISLHVYGADITRLGSSVRRSYDLPVLAPAPS